MNFLSVKFLDAHAAAQPIDLLDFRWCDFLITKDVLPEVLDARLWLPLRLMKAFPVGLVEDGDDAASTA